MAKKIICVWIGTFQSEDNFYNDYLNFNYENDDYAESGFSKDAELDYYDEDFMESWWFDSLEIKELIKHKECLLDSEYFFDDLITELKKSKLKDRNTISFLFGQSGHNSTNEELFEYNGIVKFDKPIEFIFKKEYEVK